MPPSPSARSFGVVVSGLSVEHEAGWRALWAAYCGDAVTREITDATWQRLLERNSRIGGIVAMIGTEVVGFINFVEHDCTWESKSVCYVEDLYVSPLKRGRELGVGVKLATHLLDRLNSGEWARLYGITRSDNVPAQRFYSVFALGERYFRYVVLPKKSAPAFHLVQRGQHADLWVARGLTGFVESVPDKGSAGRFSMDEAKSILDRLGSAAAFEVVPCG